MAMLLHKPKYLVKWVTSFMEIPMGYCMDKFFYKYLCRFLYQYVFQQVFVTHDVIRTFHHVMSYVTLTFNFFHRKKQHGHNLMVCQSRSLNVSALNLWMVQKRRKVAVLVVSHFVWVDRVCDSLFVTNITSCEKRRHHSGLKFEKKVQFVREGLNQHFLMNLPLKTQFHQA